jgi:hypothetical protein
VSKLAEIEEVLPKLSPEELDRVEAVLQRLRHERTVDMRFDGRSWPTSPTEISALLNELDALPPLLGQDDVERFDAWRAAERERQKALFQNNGVQSLFT